MSTEPTAKTRPYRKRARARKEEETRRRIAVAAMELHGSIGPARTTMSAVAERAGVQRTTLYRHFPDEEALFGACSAHWASLHPAPDAEAWAGIADHAERLRTALGELYSWYASDPRMLRNVERDAALVPSMGAVMAESRRGTEAMVAVLCRGRPERGRARRRVRAAIAHVASFGAWDALVGSGGLGEEEAVEVAAAMAEAAAGAG